MVERTPSLIQNQFLEKDLNNLTLKSFLEIEFFREMIHDEDINLLKNLFLIKIESEKTRKKNKRKGQYPKALQIEGKILTSDLEKSNGIDKYYINFIFKTNGFHSGYQNKRDIMKKNSNQNNYFKLVLIAEFDEYETNICQNIKQISMDLKTLSYLENNIFKDYHVKEKKKDKFRQKDFNIKFLKRPFSFFDIFKEWDRSEVIEFNHSNFFQHKFSNLDSQNLSILTTTLFVNLLLQIFPKVIFHNKHNKTYDYLNDEIYQEVIRKIDIKNLKIRRDKIWSSFKKKEDDFYY